MKHNNHDYVDLGLPSGLKWATCNVGANSPEEYGDYFAWGETAPQDNYNLDTYKFTTDGGTTFTKYNGTDGKTTLDSEDDAATVNWGGKWRMPTDDDWTELRENCTWTWTSLNGTKGYEVKSKTNGNTIFLPAAGYRYDDEPDYAGRDGGYWSSSLNAGNPDDAWDVVFGSGDLGRGGDYRYGGQSVRPVCTSNVTTGTENGYNWVNLGLPSGLKWATCNVGANSPEEYGDYFACGETKPKDNYNWDTYKLTTDGGITFTKYNGTDGKTTLDPEDDAATVNWGGKWRMPTDDEWTELRNECTWTWTSLNGTKGYEVKSKTNGNTIFLPAAGYLDNAYLYYAGSSGYYWSSSLITSRAWLVGFDFASAVEYNGSRYYGRSVRPVCKKN